MVLLRAINLGARNKVPMGRLREIFADLGATRVSTYIQSGNIVCLPPSGDFGGAVADAVAAEFGVTTTAVVRTARKVDAALAAYPFEVADPKLAAICFLERTPDPTLAGELADRDFGDDVCAVIGADVHIRYVQGVHGSRLSSSAITRALGGVEGTARNLSTVRKLAAMSEAAAAHET